MPPTIADYNEAAWHTTGTSKATGVVTWSAGDLIVVLCGNESQGAAGTPNVPTASGLTFSSIVAGGTGSLCGTRASAATAASGGSGAITVSQTGAGSEMGAAAWVISNHGGLGNNAEQHTATHTVALSQSAGSLVLWAAFDFNAAAAQALSPTPDNTRENSQGSGTYTAYAADLNNVSGGSVGYGLSAGGTTGIISILAVEVKAGVGAIAVSPARMPLGC